MKIIPLFKCRNLKDAIDFYTGVLDFKLKYADTLANNWGGADLVNEDAELQLTTYESDSLYGSVVNVWVDDEDSRFAKYLERGLDISHKKDSPVHQGPLNQT